MQKKNELRMFYEQNKDYKRYIDECVKTYGRNVDYLLSTPIAEEYYKYLKENERKDI